MIHLPRNNAKVMTKDYNIVPANYAVVIATTDFERKHVLECEGKDFRVLRNCETEESASWELAHWLNGCASLEERKRYHIAKYV